MIGALALAVGLGTDQGALAALVLGVRVGLELAFDRELAAAVMMVPGNLLSGRIRALAAAAADRA